MSLEELINIALNYVRTGRYWPGNCIASTEHVIVLNHSGQRRHWTEGHGAIIFNRTDVHQEDPTYVWMDVESRCHREFDDPAYINRKEIRWYRNGELHRDRLPAVIRTERPRFDHRNSYRGIRRVNDWVELEWWVNGKLVKRRVAKTQSENDKPQDTFEKISYNL